MVVMPDIEELLLALHRNAVDGVIRQLAVQSSQQFFHLANYILDYVMPTWLGSADRSYPR